MFSVLSICGICVIIVTIMMLSGGKKIIINYIPKRSLIEEEKFSSLIGKDVNLNSSMVLIRTPILPFEIYDPRTMSDDVIYCIKNYNDETIILTESIYDLQVYIFNQELQQWLQLYKRGRYGKEYAYIVPDRDNDDCINFGMFSPNNLIGKFRSKIVRLYAPGNGALSGKKYGAYMDVRIK